MLTFDNTSVRTIHQIAKRSIRLDGASLGHRVHMCGDFRNSDAQHCVLLPFIRKRIERGEKPFTSSILDDPTSTSSDWRQPDLIWLAPAVAASLKRGHGPACISAMPDSIWTKRWFRSRRSWKKLSGKS